MDTSWLNAELFTAVLIFFLVSALPSAAFGAVLAKRTGRPAWHGMLPGFFLPWIGLLFVGNQPSGERRMGGPARYAMVMLFVAAVMVMISVFLPWISGDGRLIGQQGEFTYAPNQVLPVAILVWLMALALLVGALGLLFRGGMSVALTTAIVVSLLGGALLATWYLFGPAGVFLSEARLDDAEWNVDIGPGGWIALIALITAYLSVIVVPFGLKLTPMQPTLPPPPPPQQQWVGPQQQWGQGQPPARQRPQGPGATW